MRVRLIGSHATVLAAAIGATLACAPRPAGAPAPAMSDTQLVSVGYGTQSRRDLTGSVSSLSGADIDRWRATRVEELLQGRVAGLQVSRTPSGELSVRIRGASSFMSDAEPLFVVDGMPLMTHGIMSAVAGISPQDIERIDVLKDAGSTAIYGTQGANGVILIRTKRHR